MPQRPMGVVVDVGEAGVVEEDVAVGAVEASRVLPVVVVAVDIRVPRADPVLPVAGGCHGLLVAAEVVAIHGHLAVAVDIRVLPVGAAAASLVRQEVVVVHVPRNYRPVAHNARAVEVVVEAECRPRRLSVLPVVAIVGHSAEALLNFLQVAADPGLIARGPELEPAQDKHRRGPEVWTVRAAALQAGLHSFPASPARASQIVPARNPGNARVPAILEISLV